MGILTAILEYYRLLKPKMRIFRIVEFNEIKQTLKVSMVRSVEFDA